MLVQAHNNPLASFWLMLGGLNTMINETMYGLGNAPSAIRELFAYGLERKAEIGEDKVFDFSIGATPASQLPIR